MDPVALAVIFGGVGFALVLGVGLWLLNRSYKKRQVGEPERVLLLNEPFAYEEFMVPPGGVFPSGGTEVVLTQQGIATRFWYINDPKGLKEMQQVPVGRPPQWRTNDLGRVIRDHLRAVVGAAKAA
jgi:hypothetical protein